MRTENLYLPLGRLVAQVHNYHFLQVFFIALDRVHPDHRGDDWNKAFLQKELRWIFRLQATAAPGLNEAITFLTFLEVYSSKGLRGRKRIN